jgi:hypothetical protein
MASWKEIEELKRNPARARHMAKFLLATPDLSTWEEGFLESIESREGPLSTRQAEKLVEIRDDLRRVSSIKGFSVKTMLPACYEARLDLHDESDIEFLERLSASNTTEWRYRDACRVLYCARKLHVIDG